MTMTTADKQTLIDDATAGRIARPLSSQERHTLFHEGLRLIDRARQLLERARRSHEKTMTRGPLPGLRPLSPVTGRPLAGIPLLITTRPRS